MYFFIPVPAGSSQELIKTPEYEESMSSETSQANHDGYRIACHHTGEGEGSANTDEEDPDNRVVVVQEGGMEFHQV